jgi:sugar phosphate isomerase/epimerase
VAEGFIDYHAFLEALGAGGFDGTVAYEMCSPLRDGSVLEVLDRYAQRFLEFVKRHRLENGSLPPARDRIRRFPAQQ